MMNEKNKLKNIHLYIDDSGVRHPTRKQGKAPAHGYDWFAIGGFIIKEDDEKEARIMHDAFIKKWNFSHPLHSSEIRSGNNNFSWLRGLGEEDRNIFYEELYCLMRDMPVEGIACVIDRPGYNIRYGDKYKEDPWMLCKTSFSVISERSAKIAISRNSKLRIFMEKCNKKEDYLISEYYKELKKDGLPFDSGTSSKYRPLTINQISETIVDLKFKSKRSPMVQIADLYLWPICMGGYNKNNRTYKRLKEDGKLIEFSLNENEVFSMGTKYSCF